MKKLLFISVFAVVAITMSAQINFIKKIDKTYLSFTHYLDFEAHYSAMYGEYAYVYDEQSHNLILYNEHFEEEKLIPIRDVEDAKYVGISYVTKDLLSTDSKICFIVEAQFGNNEPVPQGQEQEQAKPYSKVWIYNENGIIVKDFETNFDNHISIQCVSLNNIKYLVICSRYWDSQLSEDIENYYIYSLPNTSTAISSVSAKKIAPAYPNPATDMINLPYESKQASSMFIYDSKGNQIERRHIATGIGEVQLDVKNYPAGMYFYEANGVSNTFIVK